MKKTYPFCGKGELKRTSVNFPKDVYEKLEAIAKREGFTMTDMLRAAADVVLLIEDEEDDGRLTFVVEQDEKQTPVRLISFRKATIQKDVNAST